MECLAGTIACGAGALLAWALARLLLRLTFALSFGRGRRVYLSESGASWSSTPPGPSSDTPASSSTVVTA